MNKAKKQIQVSKTPAPIKPLSGSGRVSISSPAPSSPRWTVWRNMMEIELWEAVSLSLNYEPSDMPVYLGAYDQLGDDPFRICPRSFLDRLQTANSNGGIAFPLKPVHQLKARCLVDLSVFGAWAAQLWSGLPGDFPIRREVQPCEAVIAVPVDALSRLPSRAEPLGGDSITPLIWTICYDLAEARKKVTARPVMAELRMLASAQSKPHPLLGSVAGGVVYEYEKGTEEELTSKRLQKRIGEWKKRKIGG